LDYYQLELDTSKIVTLPVRARFGYNDVHFFILY
jgi:hypothetical protein